MLSDITQIQKTNFIDSTYEVLKRVKIIATESGIVVARG